MTRNVPVGAWQACPTRVEHATSPTRASALDSSLKVDRRSSLCRTRLRGAHAHSGVFPPSPCGFSPPSEGASGIPAQCCWSSTSTLALRLCLPVLRGSYLKYEKANGSHRGAEGHGHGSASVLYTSLCWPRARGFRSFASCALVSISMMTDGDNLSADANPHMSGSPGTQHRSSCTLVSTTTSDKSFLSSLSTPFSLGNILGICGSHMWYDYLEKHTIEHIDVRDRSRRRFGAKPDAMRHGARRFATQRTR